MQQILVYRLLHIYSEKYLLISESTEAPSQ